MSTDSTTAPQAPIEHVFVLMLGNRSFDHLFALSGIPILGAGTDTAFQYGGEAEDWQKVTSSSYTASDGTQFEIHAYQNSATGQVVEQKTIFPGGF